MRSNGNILYSGDITVERKCYLTVFVIMAYSVTCGKDLNQMKGNELSVINQCQLL